MGKNTPIPAFLASSVYVREKTAKIAATEAQKFFRSSFEKEGFTDASFKKWPSLKYKKKKGSGKKILYSKGHLFRSIKKHEQTISRVIVASDAVYADVHNSGGTITRSNGSKTTMPKRQFMGPSKKLMEILAAKNAQITQKEMLNAFKRIKIKSFK